MFVSSSSEVACFYDRKNTEEHLRDAEDEVAVENFFRTSQPLFEVHH